MNPADMEYQGGFDWGKFAVGAIGVIIGSLAIGAVCGCIGGAIMKALYNYGMIEGAFGSLLEKNTGYVIREFTKMGLLIGTLAGIPVGIVSGILFGKGLTISYNGHTFPWW